MPTNVAGFIEGTRIDKEKYANSKANLNLMPPKIEDTHLEVMPYIDHLTDVTLVSKGANRILELSLWG